MVTKIKPRRVKTDTTGTSGDSLSYQDEASFQWGGSGIGDMKYADFNFTTESGGSVVLDLRTEITPTQNFTVAPPTTVKDGQTYILRVTNGATAYTMALTGGIANPYSVPLTLTANNTDQFEFLAVGSTLELQANNAEVTNVVRLTGDQTVNGTKTFTTSPVVPSKTTDATNTGTAIATEAQVYKKADAVDLTAKAFPLSGIGSAAGVLAEAQAIIDWIEAGKTSIIMYNGINYVLANRATVSSVEHFHFRDIKNDMTSMQTSGYTSIGKSDEIDIITNSTTHAATMVSYSTKTLGCYIRTDDIYSTPFNPTQPSHPATKNYVDNNDTYIGSSAPTSNLVEGRLRYDTTNDVLKSYDGTNRNNVDTKVTVEDNLTSTSTTNALSANQGRILDGKISDLMALGKFLSLWDATTGQPISFPYSTPYTYSTGDYFLVETVDATTNYRPDGSSYTGTASSTVETDELEVGDVYIYDGSVWLLQSNHGKTVTFANIAGQPTDNTNLATALGQKQDTLTAGTGISISSNVISNTLEPGRTKIITLTGSSTTAELQEIMDRVDADKEAIIKYNDGQVRYYYFKNKSSSAYYFEEPFTVNLTTGGGSTSGVVTKQAVINLDGNGDPTSWTPTTIISNFLDTTIDYAVPYTPQYDGSPATKKYVDDNAGIQNDTTGTTTTVTAIRCGTQAEYDALSSYSSSTIYHIYE